VKPLLVLLTACVLHGTAAIVDHTYVDEVANYSQSLLNGIGTQRWFFSHASVGGNMISGINALHSENATRYQWVSASVSFNSGTQRAADPPTPTLAGRIYECNRGNPGWQAKFAIFSNSVAAAAWRFAAVDAAMDKLCYIDPDADPTNYIALMTALETAYPATRFVYCAIPLTTGADADNARRNAYNRYVRQYCLAHDKLMFDLADIEAHDTNGVAQTFVFGGVTNQRLWSAYTDDGGHLNALGRRRAALAWYAVGAQFAVPEPLPGTLLLLLAAGRFATRRPKH
jgi:hypothetical protein